MIVNKKLIEKVIKVKQIHNQLIKEVEFHKDQ